MQVEENFQKIFSVITEYICDDIHDVQIWNVNNWKRSTSIGRNETRWIHNFDIANIARYNIFGTNNVTPVRPVDKRPRWFRDHDGAVSKGDDDRRVLRGRIVELWGATIRRFERFIVGHQCNHQCYAFLFGFFLLIDPPPPSSLPVAHSCEISRDSTGGNSFCERNFKRSDIVERKVLK